jgi:hypothetical protein
VVESEVVRKIGRSDSVEDSGEGCFDLDLPTRNRSKNVGVVERGDFFGGLRVGGVKSDEVGFECAGGRK